MRYVLPKLLGVLLCGLASTVVQAADRPEFKSQRWQEDWRSLCQPDAQTEVLDRLKCVTLGIPGVTLSFGGDLRERFDSTRNPAFGFGGVGRDQVWLTRALLHADLRFEDAARVFIQFGGHYATDRAFVTPATDRDRLDLQQGFFDLSAGLGDGVRVTLRSGRQEIALGDSRLVSVRESPNVRRSFDAERLFVEGAGFRVDAIAARPVALQEGVFDDRSDKTTALWGVYGTFSGFVPRGQSVDLYYLGYHKDRAAFAAGKADEQRQSFGSRYAGKARSWDWDVEGVFQTGSFGSSSIRAWTVATDVGFTVQDVAWSPRVGLKSNIASGDHDLKDGRLETFNPLFPKLPYFTEANVIAPANFMDLHPTLTLAPVKGVSVAMGWDVLWKEQTTDAYYAPPFTPIRGTKGSGRFIGQQANVDMSYDITSYLSVAGSYVHFWASDGLKAVGGRDGDYIGTWTTARF